MESIELPAKPFYRGRNVVHQLRRILLRRDGGDLSDGQLLERYLTDRDEYAFEALVVRHGPMVLGVCQRVLRKDPDADDAFQATFLVLVRRAAAIMPRDAVGHWLYGVAYRTALKMKTLAARRQAKERERAEMAINGHLRADMSQELSGLLDEAMNRLPAKFQIPMVLCYLEGHSKHEIARRLGLPEGTVSSRLARARDMLRQRLESRGLATTMGSLVALLTQCVKSEALPPPLIQSTVHAATQFAAGTLAASLSPHVIVLTQGVLRTMFLSKVQAVSAFLVATLLFVGGVGGIARQAFASGDKPDAPTAQKKAPAAKPADAQGDKPKDGKGKRPGALATLDVVDLKQATIAVSLKKSGDKLTLAVGKDVTIQVNGKDAKLADLKQGDLVLVSLVVVDKNDPPTLTGIQAGTDIRESTPKPTGAQPNAAPRPPKPANSAPAPAPKSPTPNPANPAPKSDSQK